MNRLVLIDTLNFFHRAFHAYPPQLTTLQGESINAVYGFATMLFNLGVELKPTHLAVAYESEKEPTFRVLEFPAYKATRVPLPPEEQVQFDSQLPLLGEFLAAAKITALRAEGFEADDLIGTAVHQLPSDTEAVVASNDRDLTQLISPRVHFYLPAVGSKQKAKLYGEKEFFEEYGFPTAQKVYYKLATIVTDAPVKIDYEKLRFLGFDRPEVHALFERWGFRSLLKKMAGEEPVLDNKDQMKLL